MSALLGALDRVQGTLPSSINLRFHKSLLKAYCNNIDPIAIDHARQVKQESGDLLFKLCWLFSSVAWQASIFTDEHTFCDSGSIFCVSGLHQ